MTTSSHRLAKLTEEEVIKIFRSGEPMHKLAERYGVVLSTIYSIQRSLTWTHITDKIQG